MNDFSKTLEYKSDISKITVNIKYENGRLSISSYGKENIDGKWYDSSAGQAYDELLEHHPQSYKLVELWKRWHLNDLRAGDELQEGYLRAWGKGGGYEERCAALENAGILVHNGYKYGTSWKTEKVPSVVLMKLKTMEV